MIIYIFVSDVDGPISIWFGLQNIVFTVCNFLHGVNMVIEFI